METNREVTRNSKKEVVT